MARTLGAESRDHAQVRLKDLGHFDHATSAYPLSGDSSGVSPDRNRPRARDQIAPFAIASYGGEENAKAQAVPTAPWARWPLRLRAPFRKGG